MTEKEVIIQKPGTGKYAGITIFSFVIFPNQEEAEKFKVAVTDTTEEGGKK